MGMRTLFARAGRVWNRKSRITAGRKHRPYEAMVRNYRLETLQYSGFLFAAGWTIVLAFLIHELTGRSTVKRIEYGR